jgi:hypothetical protein
MAPTMTMMTWPVPGVPSLGRNTHTHMTFAFILYFHPLLPTHLVEHLVATIDLIVTGLWHYRTR